MSWAIPLLNTQHKDFEKDTACSLDTVGYALYHLEAGLHVPRSLWRLSSLTVLTHFCILLSPRLWLFSNYHKVIKTTMYAVLFIGWVTPESILLLLFHLILWGPRVSWTLLFLFYWGRNWKEKRILHLLEGHAAPSQGTGIWTQVSRAPDHRLRTLCWPTSKISSGLGWGLF